MTMTLQFLGANRQVTGSCYLLEADGTRVLIDCGMFQERDYQSRNWSKFPVEPSSIDFLLLTHAHLDHCGLIPKLVRDGLNCPILTTEASRDLAEIILEDAADIQEEDAAYKRKRHQREGRTGPHPEAPLYESRDARAAMPLFNPVSYNAPFELRRTNRTATVRERHAAQSQDAHVLSASRNGELTVTYRDAGHILGAAMIEIAARTDGETRTLVFSGDIGQRDKPIVHDPATFAAADYVVMESTYGGRRHEKDEDVDVQLERIINETVDNGGNVVIPTFAVERAQELMYHVGGLVYAKRIPPLMAFLDSPMAVDVTEVFRRHRSLMDEDARTRLESGEQLFRFPGLKLVRTADESKGINRVRGSCIIMAGSGMCTAGRIKHHLVQNISRPESTILFVGYQAEGTLGREIVDGAKSVRIIGEERPVKARIEQINGLSAHADHDGLMDWIGALKSPPKRVFLTHGETAAAEALAEAIREQHDFDVAIPTYRETVELA